MNLKEKLGSKSDSKTLEIFSHEVISSLKLIRKSFVLALQSDDKLAMKNQLKSIELCTSQLLNNVHNAFDLEYGNDEANGNGFRVELMLKKDGVLSENTIENSALHALIVDDNSETLAILKQILESHNINCTLARDCYEAINSVNEFYESETPINLVFMDWCLPNVDGIQITQRIRQLYKNSPIIIMMSAIERSEIEDILEKNNISLFLSKPLHSSAVLDILEEVIQLI